MYGSRYPLSSGPNFSSSLKFNTENLTKIFYILEYLNSDLPNRFDKIGNKIQRKSRIDELSVRKWILLIRVIGWHDLEKKKVFNED